MRTIREDLRCTSVMLMDGDTVRQLEAARIALDAGLDVVIRPYLPDRRRKALLAHLASTADAAEQLRQEHPGRVILLVGSEFSLTSPGMLPGPRVFVRVQVLVRWRRFFDRRITRKLNGLLPELVRTARARFGGPITYAAGFWEEVDWSEFDIVGINLYRLGTDHAAYDARVRALARDNAKPVFVTEFGCGAFVGADRRGPGSFLAVNWLADPPRMRPGHVRDEATQASYPVVISVSSSGSSRPRHAHRCVAIARKTPSLPGGIKPGTQHQCVVARTLAARGAVRDCASPAFRGSDG